MESGIECAGHGSRAGGEYRPVERGLPPLGQAECKHDDIGGREGLARCGKVGGGDDVKLDVAGSGVCQPGAEGVDYLAGFVPAVLLRTECSGAALDQLPYTRFRTPR